MPNYRRGIAWTVQEVTHSRFDYLASAWTGNTGDKPHVELVSGSFDLACQHARNLADAIADSLPPCAACSAGDCSWHDPSNYSA